MADLEVPIAGSLVEVNLDSAGLIAQLAALVAGKQPLDADLTALAALTTDPFGRALLEKASASEILAYLGLAFCRLGADYTLTSTTTSQKLFNTTANGALTLTTGVYAIDALIYVSGMSATSGNANLSVLGAGTATLAGQTIAAFARDANSPGTPTNASAVFALGNTFDGPDVAVAGTGTNFAARLSGMFACTAGGTIIPSIALTTAAAAVVEEGSWFQCRRIAPNGTNYLGSWS